MISKQQIHNVEVVNHTGSTTTFRISASYRLSGHAVVWKIEGATTSPRTNEGCWVVNQCRDVGRGF